MRKSQILLSVFLVCAAFAVCAPAYAAVQYEVTKWNLSGTVLNIELETQTGSDRKSYQYKMSDLSGDHCFIVNNLPPWTQFTLASGWTVDSDPGVAKGQNGSVGTPIPGGGIRFKGGDTVLMEGNATLTARFSGAVGDEKLTPLVMAHYVTWFQNPSVSGRYAFRWTLHQEEKPSLPYFHADKTAKGQAEIASYQYPLAGVYDSGEPELIRYHAALMKMAGVDGVIIDFYGSYDSNKNREYADMRNAALEVIKVIKTANMKYAVCYEEQAAAKIAEEKGLSAQIVVGEDFLWLEKNCFSDEAYVKHEGRPVVLGFFPKKSEMIFKTKQAWDLIFASLKIKPLFLDLFGSVENSEGSFNWMVSSPRGEILSGSKLDERVKNEFDYYFKQQRGKAYFTATAFPAFDDTVFKEVAQDNGDHGILAYDSGNTLKNTLNSALQGHPNIVQVATWNDFAEGTAIEPTVDRHDNHDGINRGYASLETLQDSRKSWDNGFIAWTYDDLRAPIEFYKMMIGKSAGESQKNIIEQAYTALWSGNAAAFRRYAKQAVDYDLSLRPNLRQSVTDTTGAANVDKTEAEAGETVKINPYKSGYQLKDFKVVYSGGREVSISSGGTFTMPPYPVQVIEKLSSGSDTPSNGRGSGGGCDAGFGASWTLAAMAVCIIRRRGK